MGIILLLKYPRVIGHEFFGVIDAVGDGVESARSLGERVAVDPVVSCGHCYPCSIGKPNVCTTLAVLGVHADGGFSEYAVVPAKNAWKIPEAVADQYAVMINLLPLRLTLPVMVNRLKMIPFWFTVPAQSA